MDVLRPGVRHFADQFLQNNHRQSFLPAGVALYFICAQFAAADGWRGWRADKFTSSILNRYFSQVEPNSVLFVTPLNLWKTALLQQALTGEAKNISLLSPNQVEANGSSGVNKVLENAWKHGIKTYVTALDPERFVGLNWQPNGLLSELLPQKPESYVKPHALGFAPEDLMPLGIDSKEARTTVMQHLGIVYANNAMAYARANDAVQALKNIEYASNLSPSNSEFRELLAQLQPKFSLPAAYLFEKK